MKSLLFIITIIAFCANGIAQEISMSKPVEEIINFNLLSSEDGKLIYQRSEGIFKKYKQIFKIADLTTGEVKEFEDGPMLSGDFFGYVFHQFVHNGYIYELAQYMKSGQLSSCKIGLVKRNVEDFKQEGETIWVGGLYDVDSYLTTQVTFHQDEKGFYVVSAHKNTQDGFISRYNFDLEEEWKKEAVFFNEANISVTSITVDNSNNVLLALNIKAESKTSAFSFKTPVRSSGLMFLYVQNDGEMIAVSPEFKESIYVKMYDFKFYPDKKELVGVFSITKVINEKKQETSGIGYAYMRWNLDGESIISKSNYLKYTDLASDELEAHYAKSRLNRKVLEGEEGLPTINNYSTNNFRFMFKEDGGVIVAFKRFRATRGMNDTPYREIDCSKLLFEIDIAGELKWTKFFPYYLNTVNDFSILHYENGKVHLFTKEFTRNFEGDAFKLNTLGDPASWDKVVLAERIIDCSSGEVESFKPFHETIENYEFKGGLNNYLSRQGEDLIFIYHYTRNDTKKYLRVKY